MQLEALRRARNWLRCSPRWKGIQVSPVQAGEEQGKLIPETRDGEDGQRARLADLAPDDEQT